MATELSEWLSETEAAALLGSSVKTVLRYAGDGKIEVRKRPRPGKKPENVFNPSDLEKLMPRAHVMPPADPAQPEAPLALRPAGPNAETGAFLTIIRTIATAIETERKIVQIPKAWLTLEEAAEVSGLAPTFLRRRIRAKEVAAVRGGPHGELRISRASLEAFEG